jgi:hypothetical protein
VFALSIALASAASGCDDGQWSFSIAPGDAGAPDARYEAACSAWANAYCAFQASCPDDFIAWNPGQCAQRMTLACEILAADPDVAFDPQGTASCPEPEAGACNELAGGLCLGPGRAPRGAPCLFSAACESGDCQFVYDPEGNRSACGACVPLPCGGSCPAGQLCDVQVDGGSACVAVASLGQACTSGSDCASFYCTPAGTCGAAALAGQACSNDPTGAPCADPNDFCDATGTCRPFDARGYGEPCAPDGLNLYECTGLGTCDLVDNVCIPPAGDGEFCDDSQGLNCVIPALCISNVCTFPSAASCRVE